MKTVFIKVFTLVSGFYIVLCVFLYYFQEKLIFFPQRLSKSHQFKFDEKFDEMNIKSSDGALLNGLLFKADNSKGLIFYLHGNAGSLSLWGEVAKTYTDLNYDVFILDYRGYGKSDGSIEDQTQLFEDNQVVYNEMAKRYNESKIIILGYSLGTGFASKLASTNKPRLLILQAPYYSMTDMMRHTYSIIPTFILKYKLTTNEYLKTCKMPVVIFHGDQDETVYYGSSLKLKDEFKEQDRLITLKDQGHNGITYNEAYRTELRNILAK